MGNEKKLSQTLQELGFYKALNSREFPGMSREGVVVGTGTKNTWDQNNGTTVVYDEEGSPWVIRNRFLTEGCAKELRGFHLEMGAYVPHSNDGGEFILTHFPDR